MGNRESALREISEKRDYIIQIILLVVFIPFGVIAICIILYVLFQRCRENKKHERENRRWVASRQAKLKARTDHEIADLRLQISDCVQSSQQPIQQNPDIIIIQSQPVILQHLPHSPPLIYSYYC